MAQLQLHRIGIAALLEQLRYEESKEVAEQIARGCGFDRFRAALLVEDLRRSSLHLAAEGIDLRAPIKQVAKALGVDDAP